MATGRKRHAHPHLSPPRTIWKRWVSDGRNFKEAVTTERNDEGKIIDGRAFTYHPTKGWRNLRAA